MLRRSLRLLKMGYYTEEGRPSISYKEKLYRIFHRKRNRKMGNSHSSENNMDINMDVHVNDYLSIDNQPAQSVAPATIYDETPKLPQAKKVAKKQVPATSSFSVWSSSYLFIALLLVFGYGYMYLELKTTQKELKYLKELVDMHFPLADTLPNFAMSSQGARTVPELSSKTYWSKADFTCWNFLCWIFSCQTNERVIQENSRIHAAEGWCFSGNRGHLVISLSTPVSITHVTLGHITKSQSPNGSIRSAPREFSIYGMNSKDDEGSYLGKAMYDQDGAAFQTFSLPNADKCIFRIVKIQIDNNWGNADYTCIYRLRVHGLLPTNQTDLNS